MKLKEVSIDYLLNKKNADLLSRHKCYTDKDLSKDKANLEFDLSHLGYCGDCTVKAREYSTAIWNYYGLVDYDTSWNFNKKINNIIDLYRNVDALYRHNKDSCPEPDLASIERLNHFMDESIRDFDLIPKEIGYSQSLPGCRLVYSSMKSKWCEVTFLNKEGIDYESISRTEDNNKLIGIGSICSHKNNYIKSWEITNYNITACLEIINKFLKTEEDISAKIFGKQVGKTTIIY
jgi:hypothetical protein